MAYGPQFGQAIPGDVGVLHLPWFDWPASPSWLYRLTQGLHVGLGLVLVPVVLAKLWSVAPKLFAWPPVRSPAQALERLSLLLLVGGILFEIVTGLLNIQYDYVFGFSFYAAHYVGAWVFIGAFVAHVALKLPHMVRGLRSRSLRAELRTPPRETRPEEPDPTTSASLPTTRRRRPMSRRGALALVGGGSLLVAALTAGQTARRPAAQPGGPAAPRAHDRRGRRRPERLPGQQDVRGVRDRARCRRRRLAARPDRRAGARPARPRRPGRAAAAHRDAADRVRRGLVDDPDLDRGAAARPRRAGRACPSPRRRWCARWRTARSPRRRSRRGQVLHPDALLALGVNGAPLGPDHGYPARVVVPALPGVHNTKWVRSIEFRSV